MCVPLLTVCRCAAAYWPFLMNRVKVRTSVLAIVAVFASSPVVHIWCYRVSALVDLPLEAGQICIPNVATPEGFSAFLLYMFTDSLLPSSVCAALNYVTLVKLWKQHQVRKVLCKSLQGLRLQSSRTELEKQQQHKSQWWSSELSLKRVTNFTRQWLGDKRVDVRCSREARGTLTFVLCTFMHCFAYILTGTAWYIYAFDYLQSGLEDRPRSRNRLLMAFCFVGIILSAATHCCNSFIIMARISKCTKFRAHRPHLSNLHSVMSARHSLTALAQSAPYSGVCNARRLLEAAKSI